MDELQKAQAERDAAFTKFMRHATLETKHSLSARKFRNLYRLAADEVRAIERDILAYPVAQV